MKQPVRSFSIGLFTAGIIMLIGVYFFDTPSNDAEQLPSDEMIPALEEEGYHVLTESEYISLSVNDGNNNESSDSDESTATGETEDDESEDQNTEESQEDGSEEDDTTDEDSETSYTLNIEQGMDSATISSLLAENDIIDDADEFSQYLNEEGYGVYIQIGEHELSSDMSFYEIAELIAN
ncbi:hypothetical protein KFZ58_10425 [Virgibacillus sp. NKC19-16]|uniref:hypothetical protein n=1 Tax=Virgibacillus salidurans TaxID=2831673 RepID=UPI001F23F042|nr:hypothetical protein [Virgibacillus sp. NKC19-16]UJL48363.1 hypothetical protein KFZ58_10425 [Virgibacillus sp. NKC19-16]